MDEEQDISKTLWVNVFADADLEALVAELEDCIEAAWRIRSLLDRLAC